MGVVFLGGGSSWVQGIEGHGKARVGKSEKLCGELGGTVEVQHSFSLGD